MFRRRGKHEPAEPAQAAEEAQPAQPAEVRTPPPKFSYDQSLRFVQNPFADRFGDQSYAEWHETLKRSIREPVIDGLEFPKFPEEGFQSAVHGSSGENAIAGAYEFYEFCRENTYGNSSEGLRLLDFAAGWGRITRCFLRDFALADLYAYEPDLLFCSIARSLNPYACFMNGPRSAPGALPQDWFDVVVGYSIFSHLSREPAGEWLGEINRSLRPGGWCVMTTWGNRFLERLLEGQKQLATGEEIHWYSELCVRTAGDLNERIAEYEAGEWVYFSQADPNYGEAFVSEPALARVIEEEGLDFEIEIFDTTSIAQDVFVLRRPAADGG